MSTSYANTTVSSIYHSSARRWKDPSLAWMLAENTYAVRAVVIKWFDLLESGDAFKRYPNPRDKTVSTEKANKLIEVLDAEFDYEFDRRSTSLEIDARTDFNRLPQHARIAFAQELFKVLKTEAQLKEELERRLIEGEAIPPRNEVPDHHFIPTSDGDYFE